ncbi:DUF418 domain-containing protein [Fibrella forsythiae]|uniref:DUF418 domain-containing protein n=1 Tax=Fibrella forsythiae TaxID=2817061 RepID=A0ABS3JG61_9BACT|nr:DUF418 domain-containing protein [Fibrella forsythiae]MBO0948996.1 DUF418 domain-containing protein [Fibrella forsythiae]
MENQSTYPVETDTNTATLTAPGQTDDQPAVARQVTPLNVMWGVGILGLLLVTIRSSGLTQAQVMQLWRGPHGGTYQLLKWTHLLLDNAMAPLVALLFGAGILPFLSRPRTTAGFSVPERYIRANLWLLVFGIVNAFILLSPVDVLFHYGIVGVLLFPLHRLSARGFVIAAVMAGLFYSGKGYWNYTEQREKYTKYQKVVALEKKNKNVKLTDDQKGEKSAWEGIVKGVAYDQEKDKKAIATTRSAAYSDVWTFLVPRFQFEQAWQFYQRKIWEIASLMLLGMALFRWGVFSNRLSTGQYAMMAIAGLAVSQTVAWLSLPSYEAAMVDYSKLISSGTLPLSDLLTPVERAAAAIGLVGLLMAICQTGRAGMLSRALGAVGQMPLTNFLLQAALLTFFFYGYGMSYFGSLRLHYLYVLVAEIWLLQLVASTLWVRRFETGPAEWLWQSLTLAQKQPLRPVSPTPVLS